MRLPADATLIVIEAPIAGEEESGAPANIARLVEAWRAEELPIVHIRTSRPETGAPAPLSDADEPTVEMASAGAFATPDLETLLDKIGATTLTLCGESHAVEATARAAADLGYQTFVVADACLQSGGEAPSFACLHKQVAAVVDVSEALRAAAAAKARQRHSARKPK